jgi:hypothetical protein
MAQAKKKEINTIKKNIIDHGHDDVYQVIVDFFVCLTSLERHFDDF